MNVSGPALSDDGFEVYTRGQWMEFGRADSVEGSVDPWALGVAEDSPVDPHEVRDVYVPLAVRIGRRLASKAGAGPAILGITGSVAVGKSTTARILEQLLTRGPGRPAVALLATDGFLYPNRELERRGILDRKGFPESYDHEALVAALEAVRSGRTDVTVPIYSHGDYDIIPGKGEPIGTPDVLVVEGLTVLQASSSRGSEIGDLPGLMDLAIYVDAAERDLAHWHTERLLGLRSPGTDEGGFLEWFSSLTESEANQVAASAWSEINLVNLRDHVAPTRHRADIILEKGPDHRVERILLRRSAGVASR